MRHLAGFAAVALLGASLAGQAQVPEPTAADLARKLQARYQTVRDFPADFTQTYQGVLLRKPTTERGKVSLKKPSRVKFTYESPERKDFVSDGSQFYSYYPAERTGSVSPPPKENEAPPALLFPPR